MLREVLSFKNSFLDSKTFNQIEPKSIAEELLFNLEESSPTK